MHAPRLSRNAAIVLGVVVFHVLGIVGLQTGLLQRAVELVIPPEMVAIMVEPPRAVVAPPPPAPTPHQVVKPVARLQPPKPAPAPVLAPVRANDPPPPTAPVAVEAPPAPPPPITAPVQAVAAPSPPAPSPPAPPSPRVELPSSDAAYLNNPKPVYPAVSLRLREQGTVRLRVLVGVDGTVRKLELEQSSGFERLDQAALKAVATWKFVPGKRAGVVEEMAVDVPIPFRITVK